MSTTRIFQPTSRAEELAMLTTDDERFSRTQMYLEPLILSALQRISTEEGRNTAFKNIVSQIPIAAQRFLANREKNAAHHFSTYFTWYIHEEFKKL